MYGFTKSFSITIFTSIFVGIMAVGYLQVANNSNAIEEVNDQQFCAHDHMLQKAIESDPAIKSTIQSQETQAYNYVTSSANQAESFLADFTLPVVVHIVHQNGPENIDNAQVDQAIADLNAAFDGSFGTGVNTEIEFCLAKTNIDGDPSTGVTREESALTNVIIETEDLLLKEIDRWDPTKYINIWVVSDVSSNALVGPLRGYSYLPAFHGTDRDGIVIEAEFFGSTPENSTILAHEMGHYLGLYHTFQAGCGNDNCLLDGDRVCDTPPDWTMAEAPCEVDENSCFTDADDTSANNPFTTDVNDMRENYMDINPLECLTAFTQGQADRMTFFINGPRVSLTGSTVCDTDCDTPIEELSFNPGNDTTIFAGTPQAFFVSTSVDPTATTFSWTLNSLEIGTGANLVYQFNTAGTYTLTLTAGNADSDCSVSYSIEVNVVDCIGNSHVDAATGVDIFMCGDPGSPCRTIQYALDNSVCSGDTIFVHSGTYSLPGATPSTTPIALIPEDYTVTFFGVEDDGDVIVDGGGIWRGFVYNYSGVSCPPVLPNNGIDAIHQINFANLTIQNTQSDDVACPNLGGSFAAGSAIFVINNLSSSLDVSVDNCKFLNNVTIDDAVTNDGRTASGAIFFNGRVDDLATPNTNSTLTVTNSEFSSNRAEQLANGANGGALALFYLSEINIADSYFCDNTVFTSAGDSGDLDLNRNAGGAIVILDRSNFISPNNHNHTIDNCYFFNNSATSTNGAGFFNMSEGGALFLGGDISASVTSTAVLNINNSSFFNNSIESGTEHFDNSVGTIVANGNILDDNPYTFDLGNDTTICNIDSVTLGTDILGAEFLWSTGATTSMITVGDTGVYVLTISMGACEFVDSLKVSETICGEICNNGIDDDGDGLIDCFDPECCGQDGCDLAFYNECADDCEFTNIENVVQAQVKWQSNVNISDSATPVTADIDGDGIPEVIVADEYFTTNRIIILNGLTGEEELQIPVSGLNNHNSLAVADVDKDGTGEIFYYNGSSIIRFEHDGTSTATQTLLGSSNGWRETVGLADFDGDGSVEVYANNTIFNAADLTILAIIPITTSDAVLSVAVDVLDDSACPNCEGLELVMGKRVYSVNISSGLVTQVMEANMDNGIVSIADIDKDGDLDGVVSVYDPTGGGLPPLIYGWDLQTNSIIGQFTPSDYAMPSTIADIDGDGQLEIVFKTLTEVVALENDFTLKWSIPSIENGHTSPICFDFDGDGDFEVVSKGREEMMILDGTNGSIMYSTPIFSISVAESPAIVDVDGDGITELLVTGAASQADVGNQIGFLRAYTSSTFPWQTTRQVWNQNAYFNVNIKDDLTIPIVQQQHHIVGNDIVLNNFLAQHGQQLGADASINSVDVQCALNELVVTLEVCNTGDNVLSYTTPITFYTSNPTTGPTSGLATETLGVTVPIDSCTFVEYTIPAQYDDPIFVVVNDDNSTALPYNLNSDFPVTNIGECDYSNNITQFTEVPEPYELDLGGSITICDNSSLELNASSHFVSYEWQDGTTDSTFTVWDGGTYTVTVIDSCGGVQTDMVDIIVDPNTVNMTMPENAIVCPTQDTSFTVVGNFDTFKWLPNDFLDCDTCQTVNVINPDEEMQYIVTASNSLTGCYSVDTVLLSFTSISTSDDTLVCVGESVMIHGNMVTAPMTYTETFTSILGCDSTSSVTLNNYPAATLSFQSTPTCPGGSEGSVSVFVNPVNGTSYQWSDANSTTLPVVTNLPAGIYTVTVTDNNNCTSTGSVEVVEDNSFSISTDFIAPTCIGGNDGVLEILDTQPDWTFSLDGGAFQTSPIFTGLSAGVYDIVVQIGDCTYDNLSGEVEDPFGIQVANFPGDATIDYPDSFQVPDLLIVSSNPIESIVWSAPTATGLNGLSCINCESPSALPLQQSTTYSFTVTDEEGCSVTLSFTLTVNLPCDPESVLIPNAFTPDGDGLNDTFSAVTEERIEEVFEIKVYNRWGNPVYSSETGEPWDGMDGDKPAPMDVYVWVMTIGCEVGDLNERITKSGEVTLIR